MRVIPNHVFFEHIEQLLSRGHSVELRCLGNSMQPYLRGDGSEIIVASPFTPDELIPGAIILFRYDGQHLCHRIVRRSDEKLTAQGDGSLKNEEQITVSDVIAIIRTIIRPGQKPVSTQTKAAQRYWRLWHRFSPVRKYLLRMYRLNKKICTFVFRLSNYIK